MVGDATFTLREGPCEGVRERRVPIWVVSRSTRGSVLGRPFIRTVALGVGTSVEVSLTVAPTSTGLTFV